MGGWFGFLFSPQGRISRKDIWLKYALPFFILQMIGGAADLTLLAPYAPQYQIGYGQLGVALFFLWPSIAVAIKRVHDRNMSGIWAIVFLLVGITSTIATWLPFFVDQTFIQVFGWMPLPTFLGLAIGLTNWIYAFAILYCLPGDPHSNDYGHDPLDPMAGYAARDRVEIFK